MPDEQLNTLDERMVFEVMGGHGELRYSYDMPVWVWILDDGTEFCIARYAWRPTRLEDQALECLDRLMEIYKGFSYYSSFSRKSPQCTYVVDCETADSKPGHRQWNEFYGESDSRPLAICIAIAKALDAQ